MELEKTTQELSFYSERNSVEIQNDLQGLFEEIPVHLSPEQLHKVEEFAKAIYQGEFSGTKRESARTLEEIESMSPDASIQEYYLGYFLTSRGKEDKIKMGVRSRTAENIAKGLADIEKINAHVNEENRKTIAKNSLDWYKNQIIEALNSPRDLDVAQLDDASAKVNYNPEKLLDKVAELKAHREFYRQVRLAIKDGEPSDPQVKAGQELHLELNIAKANAMMASILDDVLNLGQQLLERPEDEQAGKWLAQIDALMPVLYRALTRDRSERALRLEKIPCRQSMPDFEYSLARRTDYLLQGVAWSEDGKLSSISNEAIEFANRVVHENELQETQIPPVFDEGTIDKMKKTKWDAEQFKEFCETIIGQWDILSEHETDWNTAVKRDGPAEDNKWQVVVDPQIDSIKVSRTKKLMRIPKTFKRDLIKSLTIAAHELAHLAQAESDTVLSETIPLAVAGGRRISAMREGGAVDQEAKVFAMLGVVRPTRVAYLNALQAKLAGANLVQVSRAFYDAYEDETKLSEDEKRENRKLAADRALRLYRNGGYNSQPLNYIEGELAKRALSQLSPDYVEPIMLAGASFSLRDSMRLHQAGLYDPPMATTFHPAEDVIRLFREKYLDEVLATD
jgi:hypothetical protein